MEGLRPFYGPDIQTDWMIWNTADPITTKTNRAISSGLTGYLSSTLEVFITLPLLVTFLAFFSFAFLICGVLGMVKSCAGASFLEFNVLLTVAGVLFTSYVGLVAD